MNETQLILINGIFYVFDLLCDINIFVNIFLNIFLNL